MRFHGHLDLIMGRWISCGEFCVMVIPYPHTLVFLGKFCLDQHFCFVLSKRFFWIGQKFGCFCLKALAFLSFLFSSFPFPFCFCLFLSSFLLLSSPLLSSFFHSCCFFHFLSVKHSSWFKLNNTSKRQGFSITTRSRTAMKTNIRKRNMKVWSLEDT